MSGRGKRRQVLQLGSASKLHRYGYSKGFHSKDKQGKDTVLSLVDCSDTDSDDDGDVPEQVAGDIMKDDEGEVAAGHTAADVDHSLETVHPDKVDSYIQEKPPDMDDELKNFLSEIEAIPMPMELNGSEPEQQIDPDISHETPSEAVQDVPKSTAKTGQSSFHYSMFVKGESEFVHSPKQEVDGEVENGHSELKEEDIPDEPITNWQMVQDEQTQYYYYWNLVTNEVTWEIPTEYTQFLLLHREYEEKIAKYTPDQLERLKKKQAKVAGTESGAKHSIEAEKPSGPRLRPAESQSFTVSGIEGQDGKAHKTTSDTEYLHETIRGISPSKSLSPRPEVSQESRRHKHKKEKRSHHKKKHKRKHGSSNSDEDRPSPKMSNISKPILSSETVDKAVASGSKFPTSIVPYLSDQDDSDDYENSDHVPQLGLATVSTVESKVKECDGPILASEPLGLDISPASLSADEKLVISHDTLKIELLSNDTPTLEFPPNDTPKPELLFNDTSKPELLSNDTSEPELLSNDTSKPELLSNDTPKPELLSYDMSKPELLLEVADAYIASVLLPPPPPPPEEDEPTIGQEQQDDLDIREDIITHTGDAASVDTAEDPVKGILPTNSDKPLTDLMEMARHGDKDEISEILGGIEDLVEKIQAGDDDSNNSLIKDANVVAVHGCKEPEKSKPVLKEVIDMFAEHYPMPVSASSQKEDVALVDKSIVATDQHDKEVTKSIEPSEEVMEEGEIRETGKDADVNIKRHKTSNRIFENNLDANSKRHKASNRIFENNLEADVNSKRHKASNRNIDNKIEKISREPIEQRTLPKSINIVGYATDDEEEEGEVREVVLKKEERSKPHKQKKKDKKKEPKKHRKDTKTGVSSSVDNRIDQKVVTEPPVILKQDVHKIASQTPVILKQDVHKIASQTPVILKQDVQKIASQAAVILKHDVPKNTSREAREKAPEKTLGDDDDGDIDFDLDDIDRALEVALEKKLEKKKLEQQAKIDDKENRLQDEAIQTTASEELLQKEPNSDTTVLQINILDTNVPEISTTKDSPAHPVIKHLQDDGSITSELAEAKLVADIKEMADLALNKLEFLDISTDNLSRLQVLFIELQTRHTDWAAGGLSTEYFYQQLKIAEGLLEQYELSAVPDGWACQWDRFCRMEKIFHTKANNRYYYRNKVTNRIQWEYPEGETRGGDDAEEIVANDESVIKARDRSSDDYRRSKSGGSGRRRKRDEKDKSKRDRRSSSRHYHRKRRKTRDQSNSSVSSVESQYHRRHHKNKKRKHRVERSPSVEIVENSDEVDVDEIIHIPNTPVRPTSPSVSQTTSDVLAFSTLPDPSEARDGPDTAMEDYPPETAVEDHIVTELAQEVDEGNVADAESAAKEEATDVVNTAVISKPPVIIHPPVFAALHPDGHVPELYSAPQIISSASASFYSSYAVPQQTEQAPSVPELAAESHETALETDKTVKKKKKDKKSLATGSSIMMKKKHMSTMVQKWQKVKIEVEKEDRAKELRQAAIRKKIEELKNVDKQSQ